MKPRPINQELLLSYSDDIKKFLKPIYASRNVLENDLDLSLKYLLQPDFKDLKKALNILTDAILNDKKILIVGDFDADGATSCALSIAAFKSFGFANAHFLVPNRFTHGYGLSCAIVEVAKAEFDPDIIITVDNGISSIDGVDLANEYGIKVIITDHHLPGEILPNASCIINPNLENCTFASKNLAGVGVSFYLFSSLKTHLESINYFTDNNIVPPNMRDFLDLVALGTIADVVPLDRNNKILVKHGLDIIRSDKCNKGIIALINVAKKVQSTITSSDLGFAIGPRINASGRLDDISVGIKCLLSFDAQVAREYATVLDEFNKRRRETQAEMTINAEEIIENQQFDAENFAISLYEEHWHEGVVGIVAGKLKEKYYCPSVIFAKSSDTNKVGDTQNIPILKGSARSIPNIHIKDLFDIIDRKYPNLILKFGGHAAAAGLSIREDKFNEFSEIFTLEVKNYLDGVMPSNNLLVDGELAVLEMTIENAKMLEKHTWGNGFEEPIFYGEFSIKEQRIVGEKHLKLRIKKDGLVFNAIAFFTDPVVSKELSIAYKLSVNNYMNNESLQLIVENIDEK